MGLGRRDRWFLGMLLGAAVAAAAAAVALIRHGPPRGPCLAVTLPSTMGGATIHRCGAAAARFCRDQAAGNAAIAAACARAGLPARRRP